MNKNNLSVDKIIEPYQKDMKAYIGENNKQLRRDMGALHEDFQTKLEAFMEIIMARFDEIMQRFDRVDKKLDSKADDADLLRLEKRVVVLEKKG